MLPGAKAWWRNLVTTPRSSSGFNSEKSGVVTISALADAVARPGGRPGGSEASSIEASGMEGDSSIASMSSDSSSPPRPAPTLGDESPADEDAVMDEDETPAAESWERSEERRVGKECRSR